jgi:hypothetical protein
MRLVIVGTTVIFIPLITLLQFLTLSISAPSFYPVVCISAADDVT